MQIWRCWLRGIGAVGIVAGSGDCLYLLRRCRWCGARVGVGALEALAIIKSRLCRRTSAKVGVPVGHGYNYFLACDTAERIIFTIVTGSGSGKLCWHSRGNDNG